ncbi:unnamed protein product [Protopolystoma xenopodis]|uniref:Uncharacterized protein n=1 Tax=Protopolystoma xenopodis TaxID=117903 RepID=A0A3S5A6K7_9PLAT|nr:unnamed protein product [Protopolystoma xenopodis]
MGFLTLDYPVFLAIQYPALHLLMLQLLLLPLLLQRRQQLLPEAVARLVV